MKYKTNEELLKVVSSFENGTISRTDWGHAEHLIVANHYLSQNNFSMACEKMRVGIFNLLRAFEIDLTKVMPYHETLTIFWMKTVDEFRKTKMDRSNVETCNELITTFDKDYPLKFYSREVLFSDEARKYFIESDIEQL